MGFFDLRERGLPQLSPWLVLAVGLLATALLTEAVHQRAEAREELRFQRLVSRSLSVIERGVDANATLLRGAAGLLGANRGTDAAGFRAYVDNLDLRQRFPGVGGLGFAAALDGPIRPPAGIRPWPDKGKPRSAIIFIEPANDANRRALGFDMTSEAARADAMARSRASRSTVASAPVRLLQSPNDVGLLIYHPVYGGDGRFLGWSYMPLKAVDFFGAVFSGDAIVELGDVEIFDGPPQVGQKLYETARPQARPEFHQVKPIRAFGRTWWVRVSSNRGFSTGPWSDALPALITGLTMTFAVTFTFWLQAHALRRAQVAEDEARTAQARAEVLLKEVNHRVANSLQVVASLLDLQRDAIDNPAARSALVETKARIIAVARVHQRLFASSDVGRIELRTYLESLASELAATLDTDGRRLKLHCQDVDVDAAKAVSAGIVVAELVTNAFKYAYGQGIPGEVRIRLAQADGEVRLTVEDDGVGFPPPGAEARGTGLGMRIVRAMSQTLDGAVVMGPIGGGARVTLVFPAH